MSDLHPITCTTLLEEADVSSRPISAGHLEHRGKSTGIDVVFYDGSRAPHGEFVHILVRRDAVVDALNSGEPLSVHVCRTCTGEHDRAIRERRAREELRRRVEAEVHARLDAQDD